MTRLALILALLLPAWAEAGALVVTRPVRAQTVLTEADLAIGDQEHPGALTSAAEAIGMEARTTLYPGRPIYPSDLAPAAVIDRNQIVRMIYASGGLTIVAEGRALDRASAGDRVRVMNLDSKSVIIGRVTGPGTITVNR